MSDSLSNDARLDLCDLAERYLQNDLDAAGLARLNALLNADPAVRAEFVALCTDAQLLTHTLAQRGHESALASRLSNLVENAPTKPVLSAAKVRIVHPSRLRIAPMAWSIAAALLLSAAALAIYAFVFNNPQPPTPNPSSAPVATVIDVSGGADLVVNRDLASAGSDTVAGEYSIESGSAELLLDNRVGVTLTGATTLTMQSNMVATLTRGTAEFRCPPGTEGYTVHLPGGAKVVDLGTAFHASILPSGLTEVHVTEGRVAVHPGAGEARRAVAVNQTALVDPDGSLVSVHGGWVYVTPIAGPNGNTVNAADGSPSTWTNDSANRVGRRVHTDGLWGSVPAEQVHPTLPRRLVWESHLEDCPTLTTTITGLPAGVYEVGVLWGAGPNETWPIRAKLANESSYKTYPDADTGEPLGEAGSVTLMRSHVGYVAGDTIRVDIDDLSDTQRTRYAGLAYRRVVFDRTLPSDLKPPSEPADRSSASSAVEGPPREKNSTRTHGDH